MNRYQALRVSFCALLIGVSPCGAQQSNSTSAARKVLLSKATPQEAMQAARYEIAPTVFDSGSFVARADGKYGVIDAEGRWLIEAKFNGLTPMSEGLAAAMLPPQGYGYIDKTGRWIIPPRFRSAGSFGNGLAVAGTMDRSGWLMGLIDRAGRWLVSPEYSHIGPLNGGLREVRRGDGVGALDVSGKLVIPIAKTQLNIYSDGTVSAVRANEVSLLDRTGRILYRMKSGQYVGAGLVLDEEKLVDIRLTKTLARGVISARWDGKGLILAMNSASLWGLMDDSGRWIVEPRYAWIGEYVNGAARVQLGGKWGWIDTSGSEVVSPRFEDTGDFHDDLAWATQQCGTGFVDRSGKWVIPPRYSRASDFKDGAALVSIQGRWGLIDKTGKSLTGLVERNAREWRDAARTRRQEGWGFIDTKGTEVVAPMFSYVSEFSDGLAMLTVNSGSGFIDRSGTWVIQPMLRSARPFREGLAAAEGGYKSWGFIDRNCNWVIPPQFGTVSDFTDGRALGTKSLANGAAQPYALDKQGQMVALDSPRVAAQDVLLGDSREGLQRLAVNGRWGFADKEGKWVIKPQFDDVGLFSEGFARIQKGGKWGFIDKQGKSVIAPRFTEAGDFFEGWARVRIGESWTFVSRTGAPFPGGGYAAVGDFHEGLAWAQDKEQLFGVVDKEGKWRVEPRYLHVGNFVDGLAPIRGGLDGTGAASRVEKENTPRFVDVVAATEFYGPVTFVQIGARWAILNRAGELIIPAGVPSK